MPGLRWSYLLSLNVNLCTSLHQILNILSLLDVNGQLSYLLYWCPKDLSCLEENFGGYPPLSCLFRTSELQWSAILYCTTCYFKHYGQCLEQPKLVQYLLSCALVSIKYSVILSQIGLFSGLICQFSLSPTRLFRAILVEFCSFSSNNGQFFLCHTRKIMAILLHFSSFLATF